MNDALIANRVFIEWEPKHSHGGPPVVKAKVEKKADVKKKEKVKSSDDEEDKKEEDDKKEGGKAEVLKTQTCIYG